MFSNTLSSKDLFSQLPSSSGNSRHSVDSGSSRHDSFPPHQMNSQYQNSQYEFSQAMDSQNVFSQASISQNESTGQRLYRRYQAQGSLFRPSDSKSTNHDTANTSNTARPGYNQQYMQANMAKAKDRDERDLLRSIVSMVKECSDEVKDNIKSMKENMKQNSGVQEDSLKTSVKTIVEQMEESYQRILKVVTEKQEAKDGVHALENELGKKDATIQELEKQLHRVSDTEERNVKVFKDVFNDHLSLIDAKLLNLTQSTEKQFSKYKESLKACHLDDKRTHDTFSVTNEQQHHMKMMEQRINAEIGQLQKDLSHNYLNLGDFFRNQLHIHHQSQTRSIEACLQWKLDDHSRMSVEKNRDMINEQKQHIEDVCKKQKDEYESVIKRQLDSQFGIYEARIHTVISDLQKKYCTANATNATCNNTNVSNIRSSTFDRQSECGSVHESVSVGYDYQRTVPGHTDPVPTIPDSTGPQCYPQRDDTTLVSRNGDYSTYIPFSQQRRPIQYGRAAVANLNTSHSNQIRTSIPLPELQHSQAPIAPVHSYRPVSCVSSNLIADRSTSVNINTMSHGNDGDSIQNTVNTVSNRSQVAVNQNSLFSPTYQLSTWSSKALFSKANPSPVAAVLPMMKQVTPTTEDDTTNSPNSDIFDIENIAEPIETSSNKKRMSTNQVKPSQQVKQKIRQQPSQKHKVETLPQRRSKRLVSTPGSSKTNNCRHETTVRPSIPTPKSVVKNNYQVSSNGKNDSKAKPIPPEMNGCKNSSRKTCPKQSDDPEWIKTAMCMSAECGPSQSSCDSVADSSPKDVVVNPNSTGTPLMAFFDQPDNENAIKDNSSGISAFLTPQNSFSKQSVTNVLLGVGKMNRADGQKRRLYNLNFDSHLLQITQSIKKQRQMKV